MCQDKTDTKFRDSIHLSEMDRMPETGPPDLTRLLLSWSDGDRAALDELMPLIYAELHRLAARTMNRERRDHTLQPTAVVNEAYLRLVDQRRAQWQNRAQFFGVASQVMRRILVDHARKRQVQKRGGDARRVPLESIDGVAGDVDVDILALEEVLCRLTELKPRLGRVIELRVFSGLTIKETAAVLDVATGTVINDYKIARAWLYRELFPQPGEGGAPQ